MTMRRAGRSATAAAVLLWIASSGAIGGDATGAVTLERGRELFFEETFGGNGRVCASCHDPREEFGLSPTLVQRRFERDPQHPLFREIDSDDGAGRDFTTLLDHALFRVQIPLHENVRLVENPTSRSITVWRSVPSLSNARLSGPYQQDGREPTLLAQAAAAIADHMEPGRKPKDAELASIVRFVEEQIYPLRLRATTDTGDPLFLEPEFSIPVAGAAARRGQHVFDDHCLSCHAGETRGRPQREVPLFSDVGVARANRNGLPILKIAVESPNGDVTVVETPDPGRMAVTGRLDQFEAFDTPQMRGVKHTAPYFHDNSAATLHDVVDHYDEFLDGFDPSPQQREDLVAYLELL